MAARRPASSLARERRRFILLMLAPTAILLLGLTVLPFVVGLALSFTSYTLLEPAKLEFVGLANYRRLLASPEFWSAFRVTAVFTTAAVAIQLVLGVGIAVLLHHETRGAKLLRAVYLVPMAITPVAATFTFRMMFNPTLGVLNHLLASVGLPPQAWLASPAMALPSLLLVDCWQWTPFVLLIAAGGLAALPEEPFEAAKLDGAGPLQTLVHVTLPLLRPFLAVAVLFRAIDAFKTFDTIYVLTGGGPGIATRTLNLLAYKQGIEFLSMGYAAAISILMLLLTIAASQLFLRRLNMLQPREA